MNTSIETKGKADESFIYDSYFCKSRGRYLPSKVLSKEAR